MFVKVLVIVAVVSAIVCGSPIKQSKLEKRQSEMFEYVPSPRKTPSVLEAEERKRVSKPYLTPRKRGEVMKEDPRDEESEAEKRGSASPLSLYTNFLEEQGLSPEEIYEYLNEFDRQRRSVLNRRKRFLKRKRSKKSSSRPLGMLNPEVIEEVLMAEKILQSLENEEGDDEDSDSDDDYSDNYEFKYPYYPGMVESEEEDEPDWLEENIPEDRKRYTFTMIPLPGQRKKKDQIDSAVWGKIQDAKRAMKKRQKEAEDLYSLAELLD